MSTLIFDIDGTLVDSTGLDSVLYRRAVQEVLGDIQFRADWNEYTHVTDPGILIQIMHEHGLEDPSQMEKQAASARTRFGELMAARLADEPCRPVPGALKAIHRLIRDPAVKVGLATGGWGHTAKMKLRSAGLPTEGIPIFTADHHHQRIGIMQACLRSLSADTELSGSESPDSEFSDSESSDPVHQSETVTYVGDGPWDLAAASELQWGFVAIGPRLEGQWERWIPHFADDRWPAALGLASS